MKFRFTVVLTLCLISVVFSQDSISINEKAEIYYSNQKVKYGIESAKFNIEYAKKHGNFPNHSELETFYNTFHRNELDSFLDIAIQKSCYINASAEFLEERLKIWELMKGGTIPDSTFLKLIDTYYSVAPKKAINYSIQNWDYNKIHELDIIKERDTPWIKNYPYVVFLFENLSMPDLLKTLLLKNTLPESKNQEFVDLCLKELNHRLSISDQNLIIEYVEIYSNLLKNKSYLLNEYFIKKIKSSE